MAGYSNGTGVSYVVDDLLASTTAVKYAPVGGVLIDVAAEDAGHPDGPTNLRKGLCLGKVTATGRYKEFDIYATDGSGDSANMVVLAQEVLAVDEGPKEAATIWAGLLKGSGMHIGAEDETYTVDYDAQTSNLTVGDTLTFSGGGTATLKELTDGGATGTIVFRMLTGDAPAEDETISNGASGDGTVDGTPALVDQDDLVDWSAVQRIERA